VAVAFNLAVGGEAVHTPIATSPLILVASSLKRILLAVMWLKFLLEQHPTIHKILVNLI
jgi:hypothetical protein